MSPQSEGELLIFLNFSMLESFLSENFLSVIQNLGLAVLLFMEIKGQKLRYCLYGKLLLSGNCNFLFPSPSISAHDVTD